MSNVDDNMTSALDNWKDICLTMPTSPCCWRVESVDDATPIQEITGDNSSIAASTYTFSTGDCKPDCDKYVTYLNFSDNLLVLQEFDDYDVDGNPCPDQVTIPNITWFDPQDEGNIASPSSNIYFVNVLDVLTHELGHILGIPEEQDFPSPCPLTGIMSGLHENKGEIQNKGLPSDDDARCWFKQLYCPNPCTDAVPAEAAPTFDLGACYPDPLKSDILNVPYSIEKSAHIILVMYDVLGKQHGPILDSWESAGEYNYQINCAGFSSGTFYIRLSVNGFAQTKRIEIMHN